MRSYNKNTVPFDAYRDIRRIILKETLALIKNNCAK